MSDEVRDRLLKAWRGEIEAGRVYELISRRMPERESELLRRMAAAESSHRERLEARMQELDIAVPDGSSVKLSPWMQLQARVAPIDRLLAAREAAEDEEVDDLYKRSTGDQIADRLLRDIRKEERSHSLSVQEMREGSDPCPSRRRSAYRAPNGGSTRSWPARSGTHRARAGSLAPSTAPSTASPPCSGSSPACPARREGNGFVLTAGLSGAAASALSMATGAFLAERSEVEMMEANIERERQEIAEHPEEEQAGPLALLPAQGHRREDRRRAR